PSSVKQLTVRFGESTADNCMPSQCAGMHDLYNGCDRTVPFIRTQGVQHIGSCEVSASSMWLTDGMKMHTVTVKHSASWWTQAEYEPHCPWHCVEMRRCSA